MQLQQLSWLDMAEQQPAVDEDEDLKSTWEDFVYNDEYPHMPQYVVKEHSWADGDTSQEALEKLAAVCLGDVNIFRDTRQDVFRYFCITVAIIGKHVWCAYEFDKKLTRYISFSEAAGKDNDVD